VDEGFFTGMKSELVRGKKLVQLNPDRKEAVFADGDKEGYDTLLIATGSEPLLPSIPGFDTIPVLGFHTLKDYRELVQGLSPTSEVLLNGGGLVGMGLASNLTKRGCKVKVVEVQSRILHRYFDPVAGALVAKVFIENGVEIITGSEVKTAKKGNKLELLLKDGRTISGDILINCLGTAPRISFIEGSGIASVPEGILVDEHLRTSRQDIYAAGDVAVAKDFFTGTQGANAILPSAVEQGKIAGANMAGEARDYTGWVSMNVFHFFGKGAYAIGLSNGREGVEALTHSSEQSYTKLNLLDGCLVGAQFVNVAVDPGVVLYVIKNRLPVGQYKEQLLEKPGELSRALMVKKERE
jgi:phenylglyoxylate dehydrogenase epsilon subunit